MKEDVKTIPLATLEGYERGYTDALNSVDILLTDLLEAEEAVSGEWLVAQVRGMKEGFNLYKNEIKSLLTETLEEIA
jgi:hypothetical protein